MAVETRVLVNGQWITRTVDLDTVLRYHDQQDIDARTSSMQVEKTPMYGVLTQTVIQSPLVHHILPIKLRGLEFNDVAFIGEEFVQIKELRKDGFLWDLARKENFGARIRNARVVGSIDDYQNDPDVQSSGTQVKVEDIDVDVDMMADACLSKSQSQNQAKLPPQFLLLQLDTGDSVFLMLQQTDTGAFKFIVTTQYRVPLTMLNLQPGMHLSVEPGSRYLAVACSESHFSLYALASREELKMQYSKGSDLQHIKATTYNPINGTIQKMEFLHPTSEDTDYVVLLLLIILRGKTRMIVYEWKVGDDLRRVRSLNHRGHLLPPIHQMPLLLIPLEFKSAFILVSEKQMSLFEDILEGTPKCSDFYDRTDPPTSHHHGSGAPLWVGWARPTNRMRYHKDHRDDIYIAREDGLLKFLEIERDDCVESDMIVGDLEGRCGTALACIDYRDPENTTGDLLITGGDSCTGGAYLVQARATPLLTQPIENWTPSQDFVIMSKEHESKAKSKTKKDVGPRPDRIFACVGKGAKGAIAEFRYGLEARIGLQFECELPVMRAWALSAADLACGDAGSTLFLLSVGDSSLALRLSADETGVESVSNDMIRLDLGHQTIAVQAQDRQIIQVTEKSVVVINDTGCKLFEERQLLQVCEHNHSVGFGHGLYNAVVDDRLVLYTTVLESSTYLLLLDLSSTEDNDNVSGLEKGSRTLGQFSARVTSLATCWIERDMFAIVAEWFEEFSTITLTFQSTSTAERTVLDLTALITKDVTFEAIETMAVVSAENTLLLLCGTRNGYLLIVEIDKESYKLLTSEHHRIGASAVTVTKDDNIQSKHLFLVDCDATAFTLKLEISQNGRVRQVRISKIWFTDAMRPELPQPGVNLIIRQVPSYSGGIYDRFLVVDGTQILLTYLDMDAKPVPRYLNLGGTPTRLIYSHNLDVFVVAASVDGKSTLLFIDPDTGEDLSHALDKDGSPAKFVSGLGNLNERIFRLFEWSYMKGPRTWNFIIASTSLGRLLIISAECQEPQQRSGWPSHISANERSKRSKISYHTRYKFKSPDPILSVTGFAEGLIWCSGENLFCDTLDLVSKKFKRSGEYELPSKALTLEYSGGTIYALTHEHSLEVLGLDPKSDGGYEIVRKCGDQLSRFALDNLIIHQPEDRPIHLISDKMRSFVGLWATKDTIADTMETMFEGQLSSSILKFQSAKCRPLWDSTWNLSGETMSPTIPVSALASREILGLSVDGSLTSFTLLDIPAFRFLRFIINLCERSGSVCEFTCHDEPMPIELATEPKTMMHVDGDTLRRCLQGEKLEQLLKIGAMDTEACEIFTKFIELLQLLHGNSLDKNAAPEVYIAQTYADLELFLRPVI